VPGALVTGAARGLGLEIARVLAARGLTVHITDLAAEAAESAAAEIGSGAFASGLDVREADACRAAAQATADRAGSLGVWVNNAGILVTGRVWEHDAATQRLLFDVNALGTINGTNAALELMRPVRRGHVVNVVSLAGLGAPPGEALYAATKHAALGYSLGTLADLRRDGFDEIHVSAVCPDGAWTPMLFDKLDDPDAAPSFSGVLLRPEQVAAEIPGLLDKPRPVLAIPRWRGAFVRMFANFPRAATRIMPLFLADARRKQKRWKRRIEAGEGP
jgi:NAD(P)-dependent dehydrogenase (short-subunit alcohol dehydrogenase family)